MTHNNPLFSDWLQLCTLKTFPDNKSYNSLSVYIKQLFFDTRTIENYGILF